MTLDSAKKFIQHAMTHPGWIDLVNAAADLPAVEAILSESGYAFNYDQFEQAYYFWLTQCQTVEQAEHLQGIKTWWDCLGITLSHAEEAAK